MLSSFAYTYSADGNILSETDHNGAFTNYAYNMLGRLVSEVGTSGSRYYDYDTAGNRTQAIIDTITTISYTYNADGSLAYEIANNGSTSETTTYSYDLNGNLVSKSTPLSTTNYTYNVWGNMASGAGATYGYNSQGLRRTKTINGETDYFVLVGGNVWSDGEADYFRGIELISNGTQLYLYNIRGDVIQLTDLSGNLVKTYDYDAYGNELTRDLADENPFRYCGEYYDTETGFIYLRARYYDPLTGRFTAMDTHWNPSNAIYGDNPIKTARAKDCESLYPNVNAIKQSSNQYVYCVDNPISYRDINGKFVISTTALLVIGGIILGATAGGLIGNHYANKDGLEGWEKVGCIAAWMVVGGIGGGMIGYFAAPAYIGYTGITGFSISTSGITAFGLSSGSAAIYYQSSTLYSSQISQMIDNIIPNKIHHIMLPHHVWNEVGANSWNDVKQIIAQTLQYGNWFEDGKTLGNYVYFYPYNDRLVQVVVRMVDEALQVVDAWIVSG